MVSEMIRRAARSVCESGDLQEGLEAETIVLLLPFLVIAIVKYNGTFVHQGG